MRRIKIGNAYWTKTEIRQMQQENHLTRSELRRKLESGKGMELRSDGVWMFVE